MNSYKGQIDYFLALLVLFLVLFGVVMIASIGVPKSIDLTNTASVAFPICGIDNVDCYYLLKKHISRILVGFVVFFIIIRIPTDFWKKLSTFSYIATLASLIYVLVAGTSYSTFATGWVVIKGVSVQPAEIAKLTLIIYLANWLVNKGKDIVDIGKGFIPFCINLGLVLFLLAAQPDFGGVMVFTLIGVGMLFAAGGQIKHIMLGGLVALVLLTGAVISNDYLKYRILSYINPSEANCLVTDSGIARDYCWQTEQANIAVASGGLLGQGLTKGVQKSYWLPQSVDDFIFAASAEELGFFRSMAIIIVFTLIGYRGLIIARYAADKFSQLLAVGLTLWIVGQAYINIGVNIGVLPVTGLTLPFISYGGTSMLATMIGIAILLNISKSTNLNYASPFHRWGNSGARNTQRRTYRVIAGQDQD